MADTHKPFRELVRSGTNFEFVANARKWGLLSTVLILGCIGMLFVNKATRGDYLNWTIDFKGGTEMIFQFEGERRVSNAEVREALEAAGFSGLSVSEFAWTDEGPDGSPVAAVGVQVRTPEYGSVSEAEREDYAKQFEATFADREILKE